MRIVVLQTVGGVTKEGVARGGTVHFGALTHEWSHLGIDVWLVTNAGDHGTAIYSGLGRLLRLPVSDIGIPPAPVTWQIIANNFIQRKSLRALASELKQSSQSTVVIAASPFLPDVLAALEMHKGTGIPTIVYLHHLAPPPWFFPLRRGPVTRTTLDWFWSTLALAFCKIGRLSISVDRPRTVEESGWRFHNVLEDSDFIPDLHTVADNLPRDLDACFISPITEAKGVIDALKIWWLVVKARPSAKLVLAGAPPGNRLKRRIDRLVLKLDLGKNLELRGYQDETEKLALLRRSKLFLFPSYVEGWSLSVMEAAAMGALPVTYDLPAYDYLGGKAIKVKLGELESYARLIVQLLSDDSRRSCLARLLADRARSFHASDVARVQLEWLQAFMRHS